ncbi:MAG: Hpt domain-containing protein [Bdellovibrionales bacterium]|nr:Hpt domain-containing protein [Bdellovibrionales bacterium]
MNYSLYDPFLDPVFVVDENRRVAYANEAATSFLETSLRRLSKAAPLHEFVEFDDLSLFVMPGGTWGMAEETAYREVQYKLRSGKNGKVQIAILPLAKQEDCSHWMIILRDVTLEEVLVGKYRSEIVEKEEYIQRLQKAQAKLEDYSRNLEKMVNERTLELSEVSRLLRAIMESLGQGFLVFGADRKVSEIFTRACLKILESSPGGKFIDDVLRLEGADREQFEMWCKAVFAQSLPFESLVDLAPNRYKHTKGHEICLDYYPIAEEGKAPSQLVLVATDKTLEREAQRELEKEKKHAQLILKVFRNRKQFERFLKGTRTAIDFLRDQVSEGAARDFDSDEAFRRLHTIEGESSVFSAAEIRDACRECQDCLQPLRILEAGEDPSHLLKPYRVSLKRFEQRYKGFIGEFQEILRALPDDSDSRVELEASEFLAILRRLQELGMPHAELSQIHDKHLNQSIRSLLSYYNEVIQVIAEKQGKTVAAIEFVGEDIRVSLDRYGYLVESLVHVFRNAVDHGLEDSVSRMKKGKSEAGKILVSTRKVILENRESIELIISDDGSGISPEAVRRIVKDMIPGLDERTINDDREVIQFIFHPGLSTRSIPGEFSGRGVGMDAVKNEVQRLGGRVRVESEVDLGTKFIIVVPDKAGEIRPAKSA